MRLSRVQTLALAGALEDAHGEVESLLVDGVEVRDLAALSARAEKLSNTEPGKVATFIDQKADWLAAKVNKPPKSKLAKRFSSLKERLFDTRFGGKVQAFTKKDPERVAAEKTIEVRYKDGSVEKKIVEVVDINRSMALQRFSVAATLLSFIPGIPFAGTLIPAAAGLVSLIGAGVALALGEKETALAMRDMSKKHALVGTTHIAPIVGSAVSVMTLLEDIEDISELG